MVSTSFPHGPVWIILSYGGRVYTYNRGDRFRLWSEEDLSSNLGVAIFPCSSFFFGGKTTVAARAGIQTRRCILHSHGQSLSEQLTHQQQSLLANNIKQTVRNLPNQSSRISISVGDVVQWS